VGGESPLTASISNVVFSNVCQQQEAITLVRGCMYKKRFWISKLKFPPQPSVHPRPNLGKPCPSHPFPSTTLNIVTIKGKSRTHDLRPIKIGYKLIQISCWLVENWWWDTLWVHRLITVYCYTHPVRATTLNAPVWSQLSTLWILHRLKAKIKKIDDRRPEKQRIGYKLIQISALIGGELMDERLWYRLINVVIAKHILSGCEWQPEREGSSHMSVCTNQRFVFLFSVSFFIFFNVDWCFSY
jgi:hypothetical protein